jgi:acetylglutamate kinase
MDKLYIIKIGGNVIDDEALLKDLLLQFSAIEGKKILVHGGGKLATRMAEKMAIPQQMVEGRRITDAETLKIVTMVYAGYINKNIVAQLQSMECNAIGLTGADAGTILAHKRIHPSLDYGFVGDIDSVNPLFLRGLLDQGLSLVMAPITHDGKGQLLNTNADTIAQEIAKAMCADHETHLIYTFEKAGVLMDVNDETSLIRRLDRHYYKELKEPAEGPVRIFAGMIPKLDNAFAAIDSGVKEVMIGKAGQLQQLIAGTAGTTIIHE